MTSKYSKEEIDDIITISSEGDHVTQTARATRAIAMMIYNQQYPNG